ncbi:MAG: hypothetical protein WDN08_12245 [Rhizomicrobium sp.]
MTGFVWAHGCDGFARYFGALLLVLGLVGGAALAARRSGFRR